MTARMGFSAAPSAPPPAPGKGSEAVKNWVKGQSISRRGAKTQRTATQIKDLYFTLLCASASWRESVYFFTASEALRWLAPQTGLGAIAGKKPLPFLPSSLSPGRGGPARRGVRGFSASVHAREERDPSSPQQAVRGAPRFVPPPPSPQGRRQETSVGACEAYAGGEIGAYLSAYEGSPTATHVRSPSGPFDYT
jgi:hypothetical protein